MRSRPFRRPRAIQHRVVEYRSLWLGGEHQVFLPAFAPVRCVIGVLLNEFRYHSGPTGLVTGAKACPGVAMEVLIKQDQVAPMRIGLEFFAVSMDGTATGGIFEKQLDEPMGEVGRHLPEIGLAAGSRRKGQF